MGAPSKRAKQVRQSTEFELGRLTANINPPKLSPSVFSWALDEIWAARDEQMRGFFFRPARLAESMRTDDALFVARTNRLAPQRSIEVAMVPGKGARASSIANEADGLFGPQGVGLSKETIADIHGCLVDHGIAFAVNIATVREDGSRTDFTLKAWPIEHVYWHATDQVFKTRLEDGTEETIVHGDGRWVVFTKNEIEPFKNGVLIPAALVWARHAHAARDWAKGSTAHGNAKMIGELPEGVPLQDGDGVISAEAAAMIALMRDITQGDAPAGLRPAGSKTDFLVNTSTAWQVFSELVHNAEKAAARIYLGTDGTLGTQGGAPGIDIQALFGVAATIVEGDLEALEKGFKTGVIDPWCAMNFGDSALAPTRKYMLPDPDKQARKAALAERSAAFYADLKGSVDANIPLTQEHVDKLAAMYGVPAPKVPAPTLNPVASPSPAEKGTEIDRGAGLPNGATGLNDARKAAARVGLVRKQS